MSMLNALGSAVRKIALSVNKPKLHELIISRPTKYYISPSSAPQGVTLGWTVNNQQGSVTWVITNNTGQQVSVGLYRGVPGYSPIYFFGEAFNMVYLANNLVEPCTSPQQEFCLGIYSFAGIMKFPAFVFNIPPYTQYTITEYGFPPNPQIVAELVPLRPLVNVNSVVYYNPMLPEAYMQEAGQQVAYEPDPFTMTATVYEMPKNYKNIFGYLVMVNSPFTNNPLMGAIYNTLCSMPFGSTLISYFL